MVFKIPGFVCKRFLPFFPTPPRSFTCAIFRAFFDSCSSFFAPKPHGNACYAGYITQFECFTDLNLFKYAFNVIQNWETDGLQILFNSAYWYFLLAVMVAGDESSQLRMANKPAVLAGYQPLFAALIHQPEVDLYEKNILCHPVTL